MFTIDTNATAANTTSGIFSHLLAEATTRCGHLYRVSQIMGVDTMAAKSDDEARAMLVDEYANMDEAERHTLLVRLGRVMPRVGDLATFTLWTDCTPCDVVEVKGNKVTLRVRDHVMTREPEMEPGGFACIVTRQAEYETFTNPAGRTFNVSLRKNGAFKKSGCAASSPGSYATFGSATYYHDFGF